jgi:hypothetical protein
MTLRDENNEGGSSEYNPCYCPKLHKIHWSAVGVTKKYGGATIPTARILKAHVSAQTLYCDWACHPYSGFFRLPLSKT